MTELQKEIDLTFACLSAIPVSGDVVEIMAAAREHLRRAFRLAQPEKEEDNGGSEYRRAGRSG